MNDNLALEPKCLGVRQVAWEAISSLGTVLALLALIFAGFQYQTSLASGRAEQTLILTKEWRAQGYREHFSKLADQVDVELQKIDRETLTALVKDQEAYRGKNAEIAAQLLLDESLKKSFNEVVYFFNFLGLCIKTRLCSSDTAASFFATPLLDFYEVFRFNIEKQQSANENYAAGVFYLVEVFRKG